MDILFQRHCAKYIYVIPEGLRELMSDISREVLRSQPAHIYSFIADYLDALMITRENARVAARFVESMTEVGVTIADLLIRTGMSREEADAVATIIQFAFRKHLAEKQKLHKPEEDDEEHIIARILDDCNITMKQAGEASKIIQNAYRAFKKREAQASDLLKGMVDWRIAARSTMRLYRRTGVTYEEANRAATLIKAAYKGYYTRRIMKRLLQESESIGSTEMKSYETSESDLTAEQEVGYEEQIYKMLDRSGEEIEVEKVTPDDSNVGLYIMGKLLDRVVPRTPAQSEATLVLPHPSLADIVEVPPQEEQEETSPEGGELATEGGDKESSIEIINEEAENQNGVSATDAEATGDESEAKANA